MDNAAIVEQIVQSLSFEVEAVPQDNVIELSTTSKSAPLNVKIRVRKKDETGLKYGVISLPPKPSRPSNAPERLRLVSSDQTIMSFNMIMEADFGKPIKKPRKNILAIFKPSCLGVKNDDDDNEGEIDEESASHSDGALKTMAMHRDDRYRDIFGKCKPGGCLDPPFSEDREPYSPANKNEAVQDKILLRTLRNSVQNKPKSSSIFSNKILSWSRKKSHEETYDSNDERIKKKRDTKTNSNLDLLQTGSLQTSVTYSNSIITYPDTVNSSDLRIQENKTRVADICFDTSKNSFNEHSGHFFVPGFAPIKLKKSEEQNDTNLREENSHKIKTVYTRSKAEQNEKAMKEDNGEKTKVQLVNTTHRADYDTALKQDKRGSTEMETVNPRLKTEQTDTGMKEVKNGIKNDYKGSVNIENFHTKPEAESTRSQDFKLDGGKDIPRKDYVADIRDLDKDSFKSADLLAQKKSTESNLEKVTLQDLKNQTSNNETPLDILYTPKNKLTRKDEEQIIVKKIVVTSSSDKNLDLIKPAGFEHMQLYADTKSNTDEGIDNTQEIINLIDKGQFSYLRESTDVQKTSIDSIQAKRKSDISHDFSQELPKKEYVENESYLRNVITNKKKSKDFVNQNTKQLINDFRNPDKIIHRDTKNSDEKNITVPSDKNSIEQIDHVDKTEFVEDSSSDESEFTAQPDEILIFGNAVKKIETGQEIPLPSLPISLCKDDLRRENNEKQPEDKSKNTIDDKRAMAERVFIPDRQITSTLNEGSDYRLYETQNDLKSDYFDANIKKINKIPDDETSKHKDSHDREKSKQSTNYDISTYDADVKNTFASSTEQDKKDDSKNQEFNSSSKSKYPESDFLSPESIPLEKGSVTKADDEIIDQKRTGIDTEVLNCDLEQLKVIGDVESTDQTVYQMKPHVKHKKIHDVNDAEQPFEDNTIASTTGQDEIDNLKNQQSEYMPKCFDSGPSSPKNQAMEKGTASKPGDEIIDIVRPGNDKHDLNYNLKQLKALDDVEPTVQTLDKINSDDKQVKLFIENDAEQPYGDNTSGNMLATATEQDEIDYLRNREFDSNSELKYPESDSLSSKSRALEKHHVIIASAEIIDAARNDNDAQDLNHGSKQLKTHDDVEITDQTIDQIQPNENQLILNDENYVEQPFGNIINTRATTTEQDETDNSKNQEPESNIRPKYSELDSLSPKSQADDEKINTARTGYDTQDLYYGSKQLKTLGDVEITDQTIDQIKPDENHLLLYDENYAEQLFEHITSENALATIKERDEIDNTKNSEFELNYPESDSLSSKSRTLEKYHVMIANDKIIDAARNGNDVQGLNHGSKQIKILGHLEITDQTIDQIKPDENQLILCAENYGEQPFGDIMSKNTRATITEQDETDDSKNQESDSKSRPKYPEWDSLSPKSRALKKVPGTKNENQIYDATSTDNDTQISYYDAEQLFGGTFTLPSVKNKTTDSYQQLLESDLNSISKSTKLDTLLQRSRATEKGRTTKAIDVRAKAAMTSIDKQVPHNIASGVQSLKLDIAKSYKIDLALQSYQDDNNDVIIKSFDATKFPNRYPNDTVKVIECELEIGNQLSIPIGSENDLVVEIKSNRPKDAEEPNSTCTETVEKLRTRNDKAKTLKPNLAKDVRKILLAVYEEELLPLRNTISDLQNNMQTFTSQQMILKGRVFVKAPKSSKIAPLFKRCNCMRR